MIPPSKASKFRKCKTTVGIESLVFTCTQKVVSGDRKEGQSCIFNLRGKKKSVVGWGGGEEREELEKIPNVVLLAKI